MMKTLFCQRSTRLQGLVALAMSILLTACASPRPDHPEAFRAIEKRVTTAFMSKEDLALIEESNNPVYQMGSGDVVRLEVWVLTAESRCRWQVKSSWGITPAKKAATW
jgi:hypothetical protein